jgi:hypothetical protein
MFTFTWPRRPPNVRTYVVMGMNTWRSKFGPPRKLPPCFSMTPMTRNSLRPIWIGRWTGPHP